MFTFIHQHWLLFALLGFGLVYVLALLAWSLCAIGQSADYSMQRALEARLKREALLRRIA